MKKILLVIFISLLLTPSSVNAQVVINEFYSYETSGDWIELYASEDTDISGWILRDTTSVMKTIPQGIQIGPMSSLFYVAEVGNRLNKDGDRIVLYKDDDTTLVDEVPYGDEGGVCTPGAGQSAGRFPDANSTIERFATPTKGNSNDSATLDPCPTPTPSPTSTPAPTLTPTPQPTSTNTPTPTPRPTNTPTRRPTKKVVPTARLSNDKNTEDESLLGLRDIVDGEDDIQEAELAEEIKGKKFPVLAGVFIAAGLGFVAAAGYPILKRKKKGYNLLSGARKVEKKTSSQ